MVIETQFEKTKVIGYKGLLGKTFGQCEYSPGCLKKKQGQEAITVSFLLPSQSPLPFWQPGHSVSWHHSSSHWEPVVYLFFPRPPPHRACQFAFSFSLSFAGGREEGKFWSYQPALSFLPSSPLGSWGRKGGASGWNSKLPAGHNEGRGPLISSPLLGCFSSCLFFLGL